MMTTAVLEYKLQNQEANSQGDLLLQQLTTAAEVGDTVAFVRAAKGINWSKRSLHEFCTIIPLALKVGAYFTARTLAIQGVALYPQSTELKHLIALIGPPKGIRTQLSPQPTNEAKRQRIESDRQWLLANSREYRGKWVALRSGVLLAIADTLTDLINQVPVQSELLVTRVY